jgi:uncharacterized protein YukE
MKRWLTEPPFWPNGVLIANVVLGFVAAGSIYYIGFQQKEVAGEIKSVSTGISQFGHENTRILRNIENEITDHFKEQKEKVEQSLERVDHNLAKIENEIHEIEKATREGGRNKGRP